MSAMRAKAEPALRPSWSFGVTGPNRRAYVLAPLYAAAAPLLVLLTLVTLAGSALARAISGTDPIAGLVEEHVALWSILRLTSACTLCLMLAAALLERAL
jgi:hypothetical protein